MINRNYASWDITQLLPKINPYYAETNAEWWGMYDKPTYGIFNRPPSIEDLKDIRLKMPSQDYSIIKETKNQGRMLLKRAWTWEDVRLYLEVNGWYIPTIKKHYIAHGSETVTRFTFICELLNAHLEGYDFYDSEQNDAYYMSYNAARINAIKWCLEKINEHEK